MLCYLGTLILLWRWNQRAHNTAIDLLSQSILITEALLIFPLIWQWGLITLLIPGAMLVLAMRRLLRPPRWWFIMLAMGMLPLLFPFVAIRLVQGLSEQQQSMPLLWLEYLAAALPTLGLLFFTTSQLLLLRWAVSMSVKREQKLTTLAIYNHQSVV